MCLLESPGRGECHEYAIDTGFGTISDWNTTLVTSFKDAFRDCYSFNGNLASWDTSSVTTMSKAFAFAFLFNQDIGSWNTSEVTNMEWMFRQAYAFNKPIGNWETSSVLTMDAMFFEAISFNKPIDSWDVSSVTHMGQMFTGAVSFNQYVGSWVDSQSLHKMYIFAGATAFQDKYECATKDSDYYSSSNRYVYPSSCTTIRSDWIAPPPPSPPPTPPPTPPPSLTSCPIGDWVANNFHTNNEQYLGQAKSPIECITMVRSQCPNSNLANLPISGSGSCYCQYHSGKNSQGGTLTELSPTGSGWQTCILSLQASNGPSQSN